MPNPPRQAASWRCLISSVHEPSHDGGHTCICPWPMRALDVDSSDVASLWLLHRSSSICPKTGCVPIPTSPPLLFFVFSSTSLCRQSCPPPHVHRHHYYYLHVPRPSVRRAPSSEPVERCEQEPHLVHVPQEHQAHDAPVRDGVGRRVHLLRVHLHPPPQASTRRRPHHQSAAESRCHGQTPIVCAASHLVEPFERRPLLSASLWGRHDGEVEEAAHGGHARRAAPLGAHPGAGVVGHGQGGGGHGPALSRVLLTHRPTGRQADKQDGAHTHTEAFPLRRPLMLCLILRVDLAASSRRAVGG